MPKRCFLYSLVIFFCVSSCGKNAQVERPNVLIINVDDMGWGDLGFMGSEYYHTPNIDALAKMGMHFTNGYAAASNCAPSRASLLTGKWTPRHNIFTVASSERGASKNRKLIPIKNTNVLSKSHRILPQVLKENGYSTFHSGKWHLSANPTEYGLDLSIGGGRNGYPKSYYPPYGNVSIKKSGKEYLTDLIMQNTVRFVDSVSGPFFLYYAPYAVHTPIQPIDSLLPKYKNKLPFNGQSNADYATMVENLDRNIGNLIASLKKAQSL